MITNYRTTIKYTLHQPEENYVDLVVTCYLFIDERPSSSEPRMKSKKGSNGDSEARNYSEIKSMNL